MNMKKKILALLLVATMACSVVACGSSAQGNTEENKETSQQNNTEEQKEPEEKKDYSYLYGEWKHRTDDEEPLAIINEDGSCMVRGDNGNWKVNEEIKWGQYPEYPQVDITVNNEIKYILRAYPNEDEVMTMHIMDKDGKSSNKFDCINVSLFEEVQLSLDNWQEYFEVKDIVQFGEDVVYMEQRFVLKEKYLDKLDANSMVCNITYTLNDENFEIVFDKEAETYELGKKVSDGGKPKEGTATCQAQYDMVTGECFGVYSVINKPQCFSGTIEHYASDIQITKIEGTLNLK